MPPIPHEMVTTQPELHGFEVERFLGEVAGVVIRSQIRLTGLPL